MKFEVVNLKDLVLSVEDVEAHMEIIIESARANGIHAIKLIHGYGSHGKGGVISVELKRLLPIFLKRRMISEYLLGHEWDISNAKCQKFLTAHPDAASDIDLLRRNPGITIIGV